MIHYTLLPEKEIKELKNEYRIRVFIILMIFISCALVIGIISLFPAYMISRTQEKNLINELSLANKKREVQGIDIALNELKKNSNTLNILNENDGESDFASMIEKIVSTRSSLVSINSIQLSKVGTTTNDLPIYEAIVQGKSYTRESLLKFKKSIEQTALFSKVDFPIPDLTKSKDISFAVKLRLNKIK